jgi:phosphoglycerate kinase
MDVSYGQFQRELYRLYSKDPKLDSFSLEHILESIPEVSMLDDVEDSCNVIIRADLDVPIKHDNIEDLSRIDACAATIKYCLNKHWRVFIIGHIGRDKENSLKPVCKALEDAIGRKIEFIDDWIDESKMKLLTGFDSKIKNVKNSPVFLMENMRKYNIETSLWKVKENEFEAICKSMYSLATDIRDKISEVEINEAIAASNFDFSSCVLPIVMRRTALGSYISEEFKNHIVGARRANMVVFSGLKIDKLDNLESILNYRPLVMIIVAGSLAMALKKADAQLHGSNFCIGRAEKEENAKCFISKDRIDQGKRIVAKCKEKNVDLVLPIDFVLDNGEISTIIPGDKTQLDIGPTTRKLIAEKIDEYIDISKKLKDRSAMFYNGVFGKFEDPKFEHGTKEFIPLLKKMTTAGIDTYVGGGEGRLALQKYGSLDDVTHAFTAGGTVLKSLTNKNIVYLKSMYIQNKRDQE